MQSLLALRLSCFVSCDILFYFLGSTLNMLNSGAHARTKHSSQSGVSVHFFLLFLFCFVLFLFFILPTYHLQSSVTVVCVCELQAADEKNLTPQRHVFSRSSQYIRMASACLRRHAQIHKENRLRQVTVHPPYPWVYAFGLFLSSL